MPCGSGSKVEDNSPILDIQQIMEDYAWEKFKNTATFWRRMRLRRRKYNIEVPMNFYQFQDSEAELEDIKNEASHRTSLKNTGMPNTNVLSTDYENDTNLEQLYKFRLERARNATVSVTFQTGFSVGGKANFSIMGIGGELETKLEITKTNEQTFQETLTFETTSDIKVESNHHCTATVVFSEREVSKKFKVVTTMRMPSGQALISIRKKKNKELCSSTIMKDLRLYFREEEKKKQVDFVDVEPVMERGRLAKRYGVRFTTTGVIEGMKLSGQTVKLHSKLRENTKPKSTSEVVSDHFLRDAELTKKTDSKGEPAKTEAGNIEKSKTVDSKTETVDTETKLTIPETQT